MIKTPSLLDGGVVGIPEDSYSHSSVAHTHDITYISMQIRLRLLSAQTILLEWSYDLYTQLRREAIIVIIITTMDIHIMNQQHYKSIWISFSKTVTIPQMITAACGCMWRSVSCGEKIHYSHTPPPEWAVRFGAEHLLELWERVNQERKIMVNGIGWWNEEQDGEMYGQIDGENDVCMSRWINNITVLHPLQ